MTTADAERMTYVVVPRYALTDFVFEHMHDAEGVTLIEHPLPGKSRYLNLLRMVEVYLLPWLRHSWFFPAAYIRQLSRIEPDSTVLFFAIENRKDLQIIRKFIRSPNQHVWLWNPIRNTRGDALSRRFYLYWLRRSGLQAYTYHPPDAQCGTVRLINQVYRQVAPDGDTVPTVVAPEVDVYFLGIDKGRLPALRRVQADFESIGLSTNFHVLADKRRDYSDADQAWLATRWLPYSENLANVSRSRAILELLQEEQGGLTIRSLEAAFLGKKLITDNPAVRNSDLYHPSRIFVLGQDDLAGLRHFMDSPFQPLDPAILRGYDIAYWIRQFGAEPGRSEKPREGRRFPRAVAH